VPGTYSVVVTSTEGCDTTMTFTVLNTAGITEPSDLDVQMNIYPNPASSEFNVSLLLPSAMEGELIITDVVGKTVENKTVTKSGLIEFSTREMNDGVYFITFKSGNYSKLERLVVTHN
jgi:hypothetical protein